MPSRRSHENDFDERTKRQLADRAGHECSICQARTTGPSDDHVRAVNNVGVAAHIRGARPGSCRYDRSMTSAERSAFENGIWLCQTCAKKVDGDAATWSLPKLYEGKFAAEQRAKDRLGRRQRRRKGVKFLLGECSYAPQLHAAFLPVRIINEDSRAVTLESADLIIGGQEYEVGNPIVSVTVGGRPLLQRPPLRLPAQDAVQGAWAFTGMAECPFQGERRPAVELVTKVVGRRAKRHVLEPAGDAARPGSASVDIRDDGSIR